MDLKCSSYGPEHKTERFRSIEVIGNFWELVEVGKNCVFRTQFVKEIFLYQRVYDFNSFLGVQIKFSLQMLRPGGSAIEARGHESNQNFLQKA
jgi:hypothetical protein